MYAKVKDKKWRERWHADALTHAERKERWEKGDFTPALTKDASTRVLNVRVPSATCVFLLSSPDSGMLRVQS